MVEELLGRLSGADELTELRAGIQGKWRQACNSDPGSCALGVCSLPHPLSTASGRQGRAGFREVPTLCPLRTHGHRCPPTRAGSGLRRRPRASSCCFVTCPHISPPEQTDAQRVVRCGQILSNKKPGGSLLQLEGAYSGSAGLGTHQLAGL